MEGQEEKIRAEAKMADQQSGGIENSFNEWVNIASQFTFSTQASRP